VLNLARIFFSVDVHGSTEVWNKWIRACQLYNVDVMMLCGDLTGKALVPLVKQDDGYFTDYFGQKQVLKTEEELTKVESILERSGVYPFRTTWDEVKELKRNPEKVERLMTEKILERMEKWLELLLEKINTKEVTVLVMPGNDDVPEIDEVIKSYESDGIVYPLDRVVEINGGFEIISYDYVNPTPWDTPREGSEDKLKKDIDRLISKVSNVEKAIFNFHCPPYGTRLDLAPELDRNLRPVIRGGHVNMIHVGSKTVRDAEIKFHPLMGLHGHIHEACAADVLDGVPIFNPGSEYGEGILRGFVIELSSNGLEKFWRVEG
jgi:Icc-related predicted phosphoesterase